MCLNIILIWDTLKNLNNFNKEGRNKKEKVKIKLKNVTKLVLIYKNVSQTQDKIYNAIR